ncbi:unnamed protein product [Schistosoma margrebowiei]|uniref:Uncharacterized protein n=1 Tax=Schistosoma margrebowiei TaxID=48269 RepID=A0AA85AGC6_9TREM|nr:unnamed protein product [Schistosoma margrebowiei]
MKATKSLTYATENTIISPTLLLRSHSNPTPSVCECGSCFHEEIPIDVLPSKLFTAKPGRLVSAINTLVESISKQKVGSNDSIHYTFNKMGKMTSSAAGDGQYWWNDLLFVQGEKSETLTPFTLMLRALIRFEDLYANNQRNCLTEIINVCRSCNHKKKPDYKSTRLKFYVGLSSYVNSIDMFCWSPGSRDIAFEFVLAWSTLLINESGLQHIGRSNLAPESFGVIENWAEYLSTGKLSSKSSRFIQVEPDHSSFFQELELSNVSENPIHLTTKEIVIAKNLEAGTTKDNLHSNCRHRSVTLIIDTGESCTVEEKLVNTNSELYRLSKVWESVVAKQLENVNNTIVYKIGEPLDSLISSINKYWGYNRCTICSESN